MKDAIKKMESMMTPGQIKRSDEIYQEKLVKDKVRAVLALMKLEWRWAAKSRNGLWFAYKDKPPISNYGYWACNDGNKVYAISCFDFYDCEIDWESSLVERE